MAVFPEEQSGTGKREEARKKPGDLLSRSGLPVPEFRSVEPADVGSFNADFRRLVARISKLFSIIAPTVQGPESEKDEPLVVNTHTHPPHTHTAAEISMVPAGLLAADDVQEGLEEHDSEKLARSGVQPMLGSLDMNHFDVANIRDVEVESDLTMSGPVGEAIVTGPRVIHMAGDHVDDEAKIDGLERVVFNAEPTASSIEGPSRIEMNVAVEAGVDYTAAVGKVSWDALEDALVAYVASGAGVVAVALGWAAIMAANGHNPA